MIRLIQLFNTIRSSRKYFIITILFIIITASVSIVVSLELNPNAIGTRPISFGVFTLANDRETIDMMWKFYSSNDNNQYVIQSIRSKPPTLLDTFEGENKMILIQSLENTTAAVKLAGKYQKIQVILYDFEQWEKTPIAELKDIPSSVNKGSDAIHKAGYKFGIIPDSELLLENYKNIDWSRVDFVGLQLQKYTQDPREYSNLAREVSAYAKSMNPSLQVFGQLSFRFGNSTDMIKTIKEANEAVDGFIISYKTSGNNNNNTSESCYSQCTVEDFGNVIAAIKKLRQ